MATEEEKKRNLARINAMIIYGIEKGLWELLGEAALATTSMVGEGMLEKMEKTMGLELSGEDPQDILTEIGRIFVDEIGIATKFKIINEDNTIGMYVENCVLTNVEGDLIKSGIKPFMCPFLNIASAAMRKRMGLKSRISKLECDPDNKKCVLQFQLL